MEFTLAGDDGSFPDINILRRNDDRSSSLLASPEVAPSWIGAETSDNMGLRDNRVGVNGDT
jgi:hypothetical protein